MKRYLAALALVAVLNLGNSCNKPVFRILSPAAGEEVTWMPLTVVISLRQSATLDAAYLNGNDITSEFLAQPPAGGRYRLVATDVWGPGFVLPGTNVLDLSVNGGAFTPSRTFEAVGDPYADAVAGYAPGANGGFGSPSDALGPPTGAGLNGGSLDVLSLGLSGSVELEFVDNVIVDGEGVDFTVFENPFLAINYATFLVEGIFAEPARVSVSEDGVEWFAFPCDIGESAAPLHPGCAGVYPVLSDANDPEGTPHASIPTLEPTAAELIGQSVFDLEVPAGSGGDSFDLADVGLAWARYVRLEAADFVPGPIGTTNAGFDVDAVAAVNSASATDADLNGIPDAVE